MTILQLKNILPGRCADWWQTVADAMKGESAAWMFIFKALLSMYLTLALAMALELPSPSMALLTVPVVMNMQSGMIMAKSFHRVLGTLLGATASVVIVACFPQQPVLMLTAIALWTGLCAAGAVMNKGFRAYTFVLSGYTVAMIVLPIVNTPEAIFSVAVHRFLELLLGMAVTTLVFDGLFPVQLRTQVKNLSEGNLNYLLSELRRNLSDDGADAGGLQLESSRKAAGFEDLLNNAVFEGPWLSSISRPLKRSNHYFMQTVTRLQSFHRLQKRLQQQQSPVYEKLQQLKKALLNRLNQDCSDTTLLIKDLQHISSINDTLKNILRYSLPSTDDRQAFDTGAVLLTQLRKSLIRCLHTLSVAKPEKNGRQIPKTRFHRTFDPVMVMMTMARTSIICFVSGLLWIASGWSSGATGMFIVVALNMMLAPLPNPLAAVKMAAIGHSTAPFIALGCFTILPLLTTFPMLVAGTLPFLIGMLYITTRPKLIGLGMPLLIGFIVALNLGYSASQDYEHFFNEMLGAIVGANLAAAGFLLFPGVNGTSGQYRRFMKFLDHSVHLAATAPLRGLAEHLESRNRDICVQMLSQLPADSRRAKRFVQRSLLTQEACYVLVSLREDLDDDRVSTQQKMLISDVIYVLDEYWNNGRINKAGHARLNMCLALAMQEQSSGKQPNTLREHLYLLADVLDEQLSQSRNDHKEKSLAS